MKTLNISVLAILAATLVTACQPPDESAGQDADHNADSADVDAKGHYASVNGLNMYYEVHGAGRPLVLLHGAFTTIDISFGKVLPTLAKTRQIIAIEQQAHGHTGDVDRPLSYKQMADDTAALLQQLNIKDADFFGYSMGSLTAIQVAIDHPELVRKAVLASPMYTKDGYHPGVLDAILSSNPDDLTGSPIHEAYKEVAPDPDGWMTLFEKIMGLEESFVGWSPEELQSIKAPTLVMIGDSDVVRPEHAVDMFRLFGGGVAGDFAGLPKSQLAILPGTMHITIMERSDWLLSMVPAFLDAPMPESN